MSFGSDSVFIDKGLASARPAAASVPARHYGWFATDTGVLSISDGSAWHDIGPGASPPVASVFGRTGAVIAVTGDYYGAVEAALTGATQASRYVGATASGAPASGTFVKGDWVVAQDGHIFVCTSGGTPGTWVDIGGGGGIPDPGGSNDDILQRKTGAWTNRTIAQLLVDLAAAGTTFQPLDSDLTAIAALTTTSYGRALLTMADAAALRTAAGLGTAATSNTGDFDAAGAAAAAQAASQPLDSDLTAIAALSTTSYGRAFLALADAAAGRTALGLGTLATQSGTFSGTSSGTNTGDQTTVSGNAGTATALQIARTIDGVSFDGTANITTLAEATHAATSKATPVDADEMPLVDSAASNVLKKLTWTNLKATLKTYFDGLYTALGASAPPNGSAGGHLTGTYPNPSIASSVVTSAMIVDGTIAQADLAAALIAALTGQANPWTVVRKGSDEGRNSTTSPTADGALVFTAGSGTVYEWELFALYKSAAGGTTPDIKYAFGEDATLRGTSMVTGISTGDSILSFTQMGTNQGTNADGTATTVRVVVAKGWHTGAGGTWAFLWAQNTSNGSDTTVLTGSVLRYRPVS